MNSFAVLYEEQPDYMIENEAEELGVQHDGTREGMIAALSQARADAGKSKPRGGLHVHDVANKTITHEFDPMATEYKPTAPEITEPITTPTAAEAQSATPKFTSPDAEPAVPAAAPVARLEAEPLLSTPPRFLSRADEKEEEVEQEAAAEAAAKAAAVETEVAAAQEKKAQAKAAAEAQAKAEAEEEKDAAEGWAKVKKSKKRNQRRKKVAVTEAEPLKIQPTVPSVPAAPVQKEELVEQPALATEVEAVGESKEGVKVSENTVTAQAPEETDAATTGAIETALTAPTRPADTAETDREQQAATLEDAQSPTSPAASDNFALMVQGAAVSESASVTVTVIEEKTEAEVTPTVEAAPSNEETPAPETAEPVVEPVDQTAAASSAESVSEVEEVAATHATPAPAAEAKETKASRCRKNKKAAKKAAAVALASSGSSKTDDKISGGVANTSVGLQELSSSVEKAVALSDVPPAGVAVGQDTVSPATPEPVIESNPAATTAAESWDDWIEGVPVLQNKFEAARDAEFEAEEEARARFAAGLPPVDADYLTAAELRRLHEEAEQVRRVEATSSTSATETVSDADQDPEGLQENEDKVEAVNSAVVSPATPTVEPQAATLNANGALPASVLESKEDTLVRAAGPADITDFFKKDPVVTVREVSSISTPGRVASPAEVAEVVVVTLSSSAVAAECAEDLPVAAEEFSATEDADQRAPTDAADESEVEADVEEEELVDSTNVADFLDYLSDTDEEDGFDDGFSAIIEDVEYLPDASAAAVDLPDGASTASQAGFTGLNALRYEDQVQVSETDDVDQGTTVASGAATPSYEPVVVRQKKTRSKAQRKAAKKRTSAAATDAILTTVVEESGPADVTPLADIVSSSKPAPTGRTNCHRKRAAAKPSQRVADSKKVTFAEGSGTQPEDQVTQTIRQRVGALMATVSGHASDKVTAWVENAERKQKTAIEKRNKLEPELSPDELTESYNLLVNESYDLKVSQGEISTTAAKKEKRAEVARLKEQARLRHQPGLSAAAKARIADLDKERVVIAKAGRKSEWKDFPWTAIMICIVCLLSPVLLFFFGGSK